MLRKRHAARYGQLIKLRVEEISTVDAGANPGARIVFTKRESGMESVLKSLGGGVHDAAARTVALAKRGELSEHQGRQIQKAVARTMFPDAANEGVALGKLFNTVIGRDLLAAASLARRPTLGEIEAQIAKAGADVAPRFAKPPAPNNDDGYHDADHDDDDDRR